MLDDVDVRTGAEEATQSAAVASPTMRKLRDEGIAERGDSGPEGRRRSSAAAYAAARFSAEII